MKITTEVFQVGDRTIVKVTREARVSNKEAVSEVRKNENVDAAYERALAMTGANAEEPSLAPPQKHEPRDSKHDFPDLGPEPLPPPAPPEPLAKSTSVRIVPSNRTVETKPAPVPDGQVSPGLLLALEDACESERVEMRRPANDEQAGLWIRGIRELGWTELPDNPEVPDPPEEVGEAVDA